MKNKINNNILFCTFVSLLFACKTSDKVVSNHFFTKRKYTKGWYVNTPVSEKKYSYQNTQTEEEKTENNIIEDAQLSIEYAQVEEPIILTEKKLPDKTYTLKTPAPTPQTDTIPAKKKPKKNFFSRIKEVDEEGKKTNPYALYSLLAIIGSILLFGLFSVFVGIKYSKLIDFLMGIVFWGSYPIGAASLLGFHAYIERSKNPDKYKNNRLAIPAVAIGILLALASLASTIFLAIYLHESASSLFYFFYLGIFLFPFIVIAMFFYMAFIKNYHKVKKVYTKEEIEKKQSNLKKLGRWGIVMMAVGFILGLVLVVFAEAFPVLLPNSLDFYLFLFACAVLLTGLILKLISKRVFAKKNNVNP